jgi:hypothetical protein
MATSATALKNNYSIEALKSAIVDYRRAKFISFMCFERAPDVGLTKIERMPEFKTEGQKTVVEVVLPDRRISSFKFLERELIVVKDGNEEKTFQGVERYLSRKHGFFTTTLLALDLYKHFRLPEGTVVKINGIEIDYNASLRR